MTCERLPSAMRAVDVSLLPRLSPRKVVVDADGLNAIAGRLDVLGRHVCLTPHRGEFRTLAGVERTPESASAFAKAYRCTIVAKGPVDIVSDGHRTRFSHTGNPGMATGGTGDVLSGALTAFAARNDLFLAACVATYLTGLAGDLAMAHRGEYFTAGDGVDRLPAAAKRVEEA